MKTKRMKLFSPLVYNSEEFHEYGIDQDGNPWSSKSGRWCRLSVNYPDKNYNPSAYARIGVSVDGNKKTLLLHKAVIETVGVKKYPIPEGISKDVWIATHPSVKEAMKKIWQVNHKNGDVHDHHPSNLEYTTAKENQQHYQTSLRVARKSTGQQLSSLEQFF